MWVPSSVWQTTTISEVKQQMSSLKHPAPCLFDIKRLEHQHFLHVVSLLRDACAGLLPWGQRIAVKIDAKTALTMKKSIWCFVFFLELHFWNLKCILNSKSNSTTENNWILLHSVIRMKSTWLIGWDLSSQAALTADQSRSVSFNITLGQLNCVRQSYVTLAWFRGIYTELHRCWRGGRESNDMLV